MAKKTFLVNIDLNKNELLNTKLQNLATHPSLTTGDKGFTYWNTTDATPYFWTGTVWITLGDSGAVLNSTYTPYTVLVNNAVTGSPQTLVIGTNTVLGRIAGNIQAILIDNDLSSVSANDDTIPSAKATKAYVDAVATGGLVYQGGYNANTNIPALDVTPIVGIKKGWMYTVTTAGVFFTVNVESGDVLVAEIDSPTVEADWTIVNKNIENASTVVAGIIRIATNAEVITGTDANSAVTPASLKNLLGTTPTLTLPRKYTQLLSTSQLSYTIAHGLASYDVLVSVRDIISPFEEVVTQVLIPNSTNVIIDFAIAPTANKYQVTIIG